MLYKIYLDLRISNKKRGVPYSFSREKYFESDLALTLLRKKKWFSEIREISKSLDFFF